MATGEMINVTFLLPGGLIPREFKTQFRLWVSDETLARYAPMEAFAFERSDREIGINYIDGEVFAVEELQDMGKDEIAQGAISDGAVYAIRLRGTQKWAPFYQVADRVIKTSR